MRACFGVGVDHGRVVEFLCRLLKESRCAGIAGNENDVPDAGVLLYLVQSLPRIANCVFKDDRTHAFVPALASATPYLHYRS